MTLYSVPPLGILAFLAKKVHNVLYGQLAYTQKVGTTESNQNL